MKFHQSRWALAALGVVSLAAIASSALAAPTVFFSRDDAVGIRPNADAKFNQFTAALNSFGVDTIETAVGPNPTLTFGATGITAATQGVMAIPPGPGLAIGLQALVEQDAVAPGQVNTLFTFNQPITAFGLYVIQSGDGANNNNPTTFRLRDTATSTSVDVPVQIGPDWPFTNIFFLGIADTVPFNEVEIIESADLGDGMLYDNIVAGFVPEPSSLALAATIGAGLLGASRRRNS